jgi:hypothetical protein
MPYFPWRRPGPLLRDERLGAYRQLVGLAAAGRISVELEHVPLDDVVLAWQRRWTGAHRRQILIPAARARSTAKARADQPDLRGGRPTVETQSRRVGGSGALTG